MFRWLSRYVKQINVLGVGIELREILAEEALPLLSAQAQPTARASLGRSAGDGKLVFVFPGQGSQWEGMACALLASSPVFRSSSRARKAEACSARESEATSASKSKRLRRRSKARKRSRKSETGGKCSAMCEMWLPGIGWLPRRDAAVNATFLGIGI